MEAMASSLEKFLSNPACQELKLSEPVRASIPCPIGKRKEMVQVFENMEKTNLNLGNITTDKIDEGHLEGLIQSLISETVTTIISNLLS